MSRFSTSRYLRQEDRAISRAATSGNSRLMSVEHHVKCDEHFKEASNEMSFGVESYLPHLTLSARSFFTLLYWWIVRNCVFVSACYCRSQWPRGLRRRSASARLLRSWVRIPPAAWMSVCCECCVLSGRGLCDELITRPEESYRMWCVVVCDLETSRMRRPWPALVRSAIGKKNLLVILLVSPCIIKGLAKGRSMLQGKLLACAIFKEAELSSHAIYWIFYEGNTLLLCCSLSTILYISPIFSAY